MTPSAHGRFTARGKRDTVHHHSDRHPGRTALPVAALLAALAAPTAAAQEAPSAEEREHAAAWGAHHLCAGLFVVGRDLPRDPATVVARDIARFPGFRWEEAFTYQVDSVRRVVTVSAPGIPARSAGYYGDQGCVIHERGSAAVRFTPVDVPSALPDPATQPWPTGDAGAHGPLPPGADSAALTALLDWAMGEAAQNTRALVITHGGRIVAERYAEGFGPHTPQISWSQGKSIAAALTGVLVHQGALSLDQPAPVPAWHQDPADPRRAIRIRDLLHMSSGLDFLNLGLADPRSYTNANEHFRIYFDALDVYDHATRQPMDLPPDSAFRYRNSDPLTLMSVARRIVEGWGEAFLTFPQRALFDRIGIRDAVLETDPYGNFIITGYDFLSAYDWTRFGLLHLWDGVWPTAPTPCRSAALPLCEGERILPEGWVAFVSAPTPTDPSRSYGGLFWVNRGGLLPDLPPDAFTAAGFMGQHTVIVPSLDLVIVRLGPSPGQSNQYLNRVIGGVIEALGLRPPG
jgi:CubicO group peptidase (beta-lactamase class C family)